MCMTNNQQTRPEIGEPAVDRATGRVGIVMGEVGGRVQLRPIGGGIEWEALPAQVVPPGTREELSTRLAVRNRHSRIGL